MKFVMLLINISV